MLPYVCCCLYFLALKCGQQFGQLFLAFFVKVSICWLSYLNIHVNFKFIVNMQRVCEWSNLFYHTALFSWYLWHQNILQSILVNIKLFTMCFLSVYLFYFLKYFSVINKDNHWFRHVYVSSKFPNVFYLYSTTSQWKRFSWTNLRNGSLSPQTRRTFE